MESMWLFALFGILAVGCSDPTNNRLAKIEETMKVRFMFIISNIATSSRQQITSV